MSMSVMGDVCYLLNVKLEINMDSKAEESAGSRFLKEKGEKKVVFFISWRRCSLVRNFFYNNATMN